MLEEYLNIDKISQKTTDLTQKIGNLMYEELHKYPDLLSTAISVNIFHNLFCALLVIFENKTHSLDLLEKFYEQVKEHVVKYHQTKNN